MSKTKYTNEVLEKAVKMRLEGISIPDITDKTGIKSPSLKKLFQKRGIRLNEEDRKEAMARRWLDHEPVVDGLKCCSVCKRYQPIEHFHYSKDTLSKTTSSCKKCYQEFYLKNSDKIKERVNEYRKSNPDKIKEKDAKHYLNNVEKYVAKAKAWSANNPEKCREITRAYGKQNQPAKNARNAEYRALKNNATPKWLTLQQKEEIKRIYMNCPKGYHVDHIIPLRGNGVVGLHVAWNLQYLPKLENLKKGNKY